VAGAAVANDVSLLEPLRYVGAPSLHITRCGGLPPREHVSAGTGRNLSDSRSANWTASAPHETILPEAIGSLGLGG
jgi:hypothetical protein